MCVPVVFLSADFMLHNNNNNNHIFKWTADSADPSNTALDLSLSNTCTKLNEQVNHNKKGVAVKRSKKGNAEQQQQPTWTQDQLQEAIYSVVTQKLRFTQASSRFGIPKGTLYDNILGKSKRLRALEEIRLNSSQEKAVLEFCCEVGSMPYNRRTHQSLEAVVEFVRDIKSKEDGEAVALSLKRAFRWWWAFCKKYSIISLYYDDDENNGHHSPRGAKSIEDEIPRKGPSCFKPSQFSAFRYIESTTNNKEEERQTR